MAVEQAITEDKWVPISMELRTGKFICVTLYHSAASKTAVLDVYGSRNGGETAKPMARVDTTADAIAVSVATPAAKPTGTTLYSASVRVALEDATDIYIRKVSLTAGGTATYAIGPAL